MEPFGLFQLLQTLLTPPTPPAQNPSEPPAFEEAETNAPPPPPMDENTPAKDAYLQFMQAHDTRAKRTKK